MDLHLPQRARSTYHGPLRHFGIPIICERITSHIWPRTVETGRAFRGRGALGVQGRSRVRLRQDFYLGRGRRVFTFCTVINLLILRSLAVPHNPWVLSLSKVHMHIGQLNVCSKNNRKETPLQVSLWEYKILQAIKCRFGGRSAPIKVLVSSAVKSQLGRLNTRPRPGNQAWKPHETDNIRIIQSGVKSSSYSYHHKSLMVWCFLVSHTHTHLDSNRHS